ncbi:MAG: 4Fe-4S binding protein [Planctomycetes bacterium]|nr:4Fe-4S binding protein [Planctomycetota bacterium]
MLPIEDKDRMRILSAVARRGAAYQLTRIVVITLSQLILLAVPLSGLVRLDLWGGHHLLLGEPVEFIPGLKGFVVAVAILWGVTFTTNIVVGRFFCGWGCPVGYVSRLGEDVDLRRRDRKGSRLRTLVSHLLGAAFVATFVGAIMLWWVDWRVLFEGSVKARAITLAVFVALWAGGYLHAFVWRFGFCRSACPIGLYYRFVTSRTPIGIVFSNSPSPCIECGACEKICPVDIDPKSLGRPAEEAAPESVDGPGERYGDAECIRCGDCVEACRMIFAAHPEVTTPPLRFGWVDRKGRDASSPGTKASSAGTSGTSASAR